MASNDEYEQQQFWIEDWETIRRRELDKEITHGCYDISSGNWVMYTGKQGYINYIIELEKAFKNIK